MLKNYQKTMYACFIGYIVQAIVNNFVPLLFLTFESTYGIPMSQITTLITINFGIQLIVDLLSTGFEFSAEAIDDRSFFMEHTQTKLVKSHDRAKFICIVRVDQLFVQQAGYIGRIIGFIFNSKTLKRRISFDRFHTSGDQIKSG